MSHFCRVIASEATKSMQWVILVVFPATWLFRGRLYSILAESARTSPRLTARGRYGLLRSSKITYTYTYKHHLPIARIVPSFSTFMRHCWLCSHRIVHAARHRLRCYLLGHSVLLGETAQLCSCRITHADRSYLPIAHIARSFSTIGKYCSLCSCRITNADRHHLPIARIARSFSAPGRHCSFHLHKITYMSSAHCSCCSLIQLS